MYNSRRFGTAATVLGKRDGGFAGGRPSDLDGRLAFLRSSPIPIAWPKSTSRRGPKREFWPFPVAAEGPFTQYGQAVNSSCWTAAPRTWKYPGNHPFLAYPSTADISQVGCRRAECTA